MTKKLFLLGMAAIFALVLAGCDNGSDPDPVPNPPRTTEIPVYMVSKVGDHVVEITVDESSRRSARAALADGIYTYKVEMYGVVVAEGVMIVENGIATYYPDATLTVTPIFTYDPETEELDGSIPISQDVIDAVEALGGTLGNTLDLSGSKASPARPGGDGYWDGTWVNSNTSGTVDEIVFDRNIYTLKKNGVATETGTFVYLDGYMKFDHSNLFIFTRPADKTPKIMAYLFEGGYTYTKENGDAWRPPDPNTGFPGDPIEEAVKSEDSFLELYHSSFSSDVMGIDRAYSDNHFDLQLEP